MTFKKKDFLMIELDPSKVKRLRLRFFEASCSFQNLAWVIKIGTTKPKSKIE